MKRREFINWAGLGLISSYLPVALVACSKTNADAEYSDVQELLSVGTMTQLDETGFLLDETSKVMVVKDAKNELSAVNPTCTHKGCMVEWKTDSNTFVCPCHDAKFAADGKVLAKPASTDLSTYKVKAENGEIIVTLA